MRAPAQFLTPPPALRAIAGSALALTAGLAVAFSALLHVGAVTPLTLRSADFVQYYAVGRMVLHGQGAALYNLHALQQTEAALIRPLSMGHGVLPFLYPPYVALLLTPLAVLPYTAAYALWFFINVALLCWSLYYIESAAGLSGVRARIFRFAILCSLPVMMALALGQVSILILSFLTATWLLTRRFPLLAGTFLALALVKPPYILPLLLLPLVRRDWKMLAGFGIGFLSLALIPMAVLGRGIDLTYGQLLLDASGWQGHAGAVSVHGVVVDAATYGAFWNQSLAGFSELLWPGKGGMLLYVAASIAILAGLAWASRRDDVATYGLAVTAAVLLSPHVLLHDLVLLAIPAALMLRHSDRAAALILAISLLTITAGYGFVHVAPIQLAPLGLTMLALFQYFRQPKLPIMERS